MLRAISILLVTFLLPCCRDDETSAKSSKSAEAARIEREVKRRVEVVEKDLKVRQTRLHTIRVIGFIVLAGGSVTLFVRLQRQRGVLPVHLPESLPPVSQWRDHYPVPESRIIDPDPPEPFNGQRSNPNRSRNHHHAPAPRP
jgi:hypothetical protein